MMCCVSPVGVTPSDPVDQAWHLHLTYTHSYWIDLCRNTIGKEIHHNPTQGGMSEANKFNSYYTDAKALYGKLFDVSGPADIWQDNHTRFKDINFRRVNLGRYWLIKKPIVSLIIPTAFLLIIAIGTLIQASYAYVFPVAAFVVLIWAVLSEERRKKKGKEQR